MPRRTGLSIPSPRRRQRRSVDDEAARKFEAATEAKGAGIVSLHGDPAEDTTSLESVSAVVSPQTTDNTQVIGATPKPDGEQAEPPVRNRRGTLQRPHIRRDGVATKSTAFHLPIDLVKRLRVAAAISGSTQSSIAEAAITAWLDNHPAGIRDA